MTTLEILAVVLSVIIIALLMLLWAMRMTKKPRGIPDMINIPPPPGRTPVEVLRSEVFAILNEHAKSISKITELTGDVYTLQKEIWQLENPSEFKLLDEVEFDGVDGWKEYNGVFIITAVEIEDGCTFRRIYQIVQRETGRKKSCVPESLLIKAK